MCGFTIPIIGIITIGMIERIGLTGGIWRRGAGSIGSIRGRVTAGSGRIGSGGICIRVDGKGENRNWKSENRRAMGRGAGFGPPRLFFWGVLRLGNAAAGGVSGGGVGGGQGESQI